MSHTIQAVKSNSPPQTAQNVQNSRNTASKQNGTQSSGASSFMEMLQASETRIDSRDEREEESRKDEKTSSASSLFPPDTATVIPPRVEQVPQPPTQDAPASDDSASSTPASLAVAINAEESGANPQAALAQQKADLLKAMNAANAETAAPAQALVDEAAAQATQPGQAASAAAPAQSEFQSLLEKTAAQPAEKGSAQVTLPKAEETLAQAAKLSTTAADTKTTPTAAAASGKPETVLAEALPAPVEEKTTAVSAAKETAPPLQPETLQAVTQQPQIEPARLAEARPSELIHQVIQNVETMTRKGETTMRLQLNPQDLGKVEITLISRPSGVEITLKADQASTGRMLENDLSSLRQVLANSGIQLANLSVGQNSQQNTAAFEAWQQFSQQGGSGQNRSAVSPTVVSSSETSATQNTRPSGPLSGVDYRV